MGTPGLCVASDTQHSLIMALCPLHLHSSVPAVQALQAPNYHEELTWLKQRLCHIHHGINPYLSLSVVLTITLLAPSVCFLAFSN